MITEKKDKTFMEKSKDFVKRHKWKIVAGVGLAAVGGIIYGVSKTSAKVDDLIEKALEDNDGYYPGWKRLDGDAIGIGTVTDLGHNLADEYVDAIVSGITVADLGKLGEGLTNVEGITEDHTVSMVLSVLNVSETE